MATTHITPINVLPGRTAQVTVRDSVNYYMNPRKTDGGRLITAINCDSDTVAEEILLSQRQYEFTTGKPIDAPLPGGKDPILLYVARQSFLPGEIDADTAHEMGVKLAEKLLDGNYQCIVTTHIDTAHIHNNIVWNAVNQDLKKYNIKKYTYQILRRRSDELCEEYGTSIVVPGKERRTQAYSKCKEYSFHDVMRADVDAMLAASKNFEDFLTRMEGQYEVVRRGKYLRFRHKTNGQDRFFRVDSLGPGYDEQSLRRRFQNRIPEKRVALTYSQRIAARQKLALEHDRDLSYSARLRNIKAMTEALHVIGQNDVGSYGDFGKRTEELTARKTAVLKTLRDTQEQLRRLHSLEENLRLYQESKPMFAEYSHALLKERFRESHRTELELFEAAGALLRARGFDPDTISLEQLAASTSREAAPLGRRIVEIEKERFDINGKIAELARARRTVERVREDYLARPRVASAEKLQTKKEGFYARR